MTLFPTPKRASIGSRRLPVAGVRTALVPGHPAQGYRLRVSEEGVNIEASDGDGIAYARATLAQLIDGDQAPEADIIDWPDFAVRGVMLDISRDKVPTMETLRQIVDVMATWKLNHLQLYMEHTFAYADHSEVWKHASPITADDLSELTAYAADRHIELAANQNGLGHMERWLCQERYRHLAIDPAAYVDERGRGHFPSTLEPTNPDALALIRSLLGELLDHFDNPLVNVGLDEPWELRAERAADYGAYISALRAAPELDGRQMLIWGDIVAQHPELVPGLPEGVTVLEWGYDAGHPFAPRGETLARSSLPFWVCPGTSSWNSLVGRWTNARTNCLEAASAGLASGATGYLITDWGDGGHFQPRSVSLPGLAAGAAAAWNSGAAGDSDFAAALAEVSFDGVVLGAGRAAALFELGDAYLAVEPQSPNTVSVLLHFLWPNLRVGQRTTEGLDREQLDAYDAALDSGLRRAEADTGGSQLRAELALLVSIAKLMTDDARGRLAGDGSLASISEPVRMGLAGRVPGLEAEHRRLWLARNRAGGLDDSAARLGHLARCYRQGRGLPFVPGWAVPTPD
jgi:hexosaminidase